MSKMNVGKCAFRTLNFCRSPINKYDIECEKVPVRKCYYKQLQIKKWKIKKIKKIAFANLQQNHCNNCDGVGLGSCSDTNCSYYQMNEIYKILLGDK